MKGKRAVVDTNVPILANGIDAPNPECVRACTRALQKLQHSGHLVIDDGFRILREYLRHFPRAVRGPGDAFLKWVLDNKTNPQRCTQVPLTPHEDDPERFAEFPDHPDLENFDPADRKFVAVAAADRGKPAIWQGYDSKWWGWRQALFKAGIRVEFLCAEDIARKYVEKSQAG